MRHLTPGVRNVMHMRAAGRARRRRRRAGRPRRGGPLRRRRRERRDGGDGADEDRPVARAGALVGEGGGPPARAQDGRRARAARQGSHRPGAVRPARRPRCRARWRGARCRRPRGWRTARRTARRRGRAGRRRSRGRGAPGGARARGRGGRAGGVPAGRRRRRRTRARARPSALRGPRGGAGGGGRAARRLAPVHGQGAGRGGLGAGGGRRSLGGGQRGSHGPRPGGRGGCRRPGRPGHRPPRAAASRRGFIRVLRALSIVDGAPAALFGSRNSYGLGSVFCPVCWPRACAVAAVAAIDRVVVRVRRPPARGGAVAPISRGRAARRREAARFPASGWSASS